MSIKLYYAYPSCGLDTYVAYLNFYTNIGCINSYTKVACIIPILKRPNIDRFLTAMALGIFESFINPSHPARPIQNHEYIVYIMLLCVTITNLSYQNHILELLTLARFYNSNGT